MHTKVREKWLQALDIRYPELKNTIFNRYAVEKLDAIYTTFKTSGLADSNFDSKLELDGYSYHQAMSEMLFSNRLMRDGFVLSSYDSGPDFKAQKNDRTYWFEVITPEPRHGISEYVHDGINRLNPNADETEKINTHRLWRIAAAIKEKKEKFEKYIQSPKFDVKEGDACIIVINDSLLEALDLPMYGLTQEVTKGISGLPLAAEVLYGIGHCYWYQDVAENIILRQERGNVLNHNESPINLQGFLNDYLSILSGVFCLTLREDYGLTCLLDEKWFNRGTFIENNFANVKVEKDDLSANFLTYDYVKSLQSPSNISRNHNNAVNTIWFQKLKFIKYLNKKFEKPDRMGI